MKPIVYIVGGALGVGLLLALSSDDDSAPNSPSGLPVGGRVALRKGTNPGDKTQYISFGEPQNFVYLTLDGSPVRRAGPSQVSAYELSKAMGLAWRARRRMLPPDADQHSTDKYSKELYYLPSWLVMGQPGLGIKGYNVPWPAPKYVGVPTETTSSLQTAITAVPVDEYGRLKPGHYGDGGGLWGATFGGLLANPLFKAVVVTALIAGTGGTGLAIYGAYTMWENRGSELTLTNVALTAARAYVVSQCGEACGMAFDFGVGVASGESVDEAAEDALIQSLTPEQRAYFDEGKKAYKELT